jgi:CBS domain-containing protein
VRFAELVARGATWAAAERMARRAFASDCRSVRTGSKRSPCCSTRAIDERARGRNERIAAGRERRRERCSHCSPVLRVRAHTGLVRSEIGPVEPRKVDVGSLLVTEGGRITGIVTERDYLRRVTLHGRTDKDTAVREIMSSPLIVATPETPIDECMALMTDRRIRHVPVVEGGEVVGVVSIGDLVKFKSQRQSFEIQYLTDYITAG